jgi:CheY-like chemotaxis protein
MTGYGRELKTLVEEGLRDGARLCLHKPFSPDDLLRHLSEVRAERASVQLRG